MSCIMALKRKFRYNDLSMRFIIVFRVPDFYCYRKLHVYYVNLHASLLTVLQVKRVAWREKLVSSNRLMFFNAKLFSPKQFMAWP